MQSMRVQTGATQNAAVTTAGKLFSFAEALELPGFSMRFDRDEEIFGESESADFVYKVVSGAARSFRILSDGRRQITGFHLPGDVFGMETGGEHRSSAEAIVESEVALVRRTAINRLADADVAAARQLWMLTATDLDDLRDHMMLLGRKSAAERVGSFLLQMADRAPAERGTRLPMSRSDIADYLGLTIETVSRTLTQLERDRIISIQSARCIVLNDRAALGLAD
jgi:CRP/FNR family transcriptional regulator, nitrogen fixation regulation protein